MTYTIKGKGIISTPFGKAKFGKENLVNTESVEFAKHLKELGYPVTPEIIEESGENEFPPIEEEKPKKKKKGE